MTATDEQIARRREAGTMIANRLAEDIDSGPVGAIRSTNPEALVKREGDTYTLALDSTAEALARQLGTDVESIRNVAYVDADKISGDPPDDVQYELPPAGERIDEAEFIVSGGAFDPADDLSKVVIDDEDDRRFLSKVGDRLTLTRYRTDSREDALFSLTFPNQDEWQDFTDNVRAYRAGAIDSPKFGTSEEAAQETADRRERRDVREAARDAAEAAGVDLDEFGIDARADGEVIVQDRDTGETRTIDADAPGGIGSAIDAATGDGQFIADDADPAAGASGSGEGLGARAVGAIVLLFGALAAALGWLS